MIPALLFAATLALAPEHRVADLRTGATRADERVLAIDATRAVTYRIEDASIRVIPFADPSKATTLDSGVSGIAFPVAAPPLVAWTDSEQRTHIAPIDAPDRGTLVPGDVIQSMQCNAAACLAAGRLEMLLVHLDGTPYAHVSRGGATVLAADPGGFLVTASPTSVIRVDNSGATTFTTATPQAAAGHAAADFDGDRYVFVWPDFDPAARTTQFRALSIGLGGDAGQPVTLASVPAAIYDRIAIAYNGGRHLLVFGEADPNFAVVLPGAVGPNRLDALRLDRDLHPLDPAPLIVNDTPWADLFPAVAVRGSGFMVAWSHGPGLFFTGDPEAAEVDAAGHVGPRMILSTGLVPQSVSSAATIPGALLVGYLEFPHEDGAPTLRVGRFALDGTPLGAPVVVATADARQSAMAARGSDVLVAWRDANYAVKAAILSADGTLKPVVMPPLSGTVSAAANRDGWMIAVAGDNGVDLVRVAANGTAFAPQSLVAIPNVGFDAAVASDGDRFLVAWGTDGGAGNAVCNFVPCGTRAALLDATGGVNNDRIAISATRDVGGATFAGGEYVIASTTLVRLERDGTRIGNPNVHATHVAPYGDAVHVTYEAPDGLHLARIEHGTIASDTILGADTPVQLTTAAVAYDVDADGVSAVVFRLFVPERRRAAYH